MAFGGNAFGSNYSETGRECCSKKKITLDHCEILLF